MRLDEDTPMSKPLTALSSLVGFLNRDQDRNIKIIGPSSSDMLHAMVTEALALNDHFCNGPETHWSNLEKVRFYAYGASAPDDYLFDKPIDSQFDKLSDPSDLIRGYLKHQGINLQRTIATDDTLAMGFSTSLCVVGSTQGLATEIISH